MAKQNKNMKSLQKEKKQQEAAKAQRKPKINIPPVEYTHLPLEPLKFENREWKVFIGLCILALVSRFYGFSTKSFWIDEHGVYADAQTIFMSGIFSKAYISRPHFIYFSIVNIFVKFGLSEFTLRFPSCLAGALVVPSIYILCKRIFNTNIAVITSILVIFSPYQIHFSHEARYYTLVVLVSIWMIYLVFLYANKFNVLYIPCIILLGIINYGIHPATAVFTFAFLLFIAGLFVYLKHYRFIPYIFKRGMGYKITFFAGIIAAVVMLLFIRTMADQHFKSLYSRLLNYKTMQFTQEVGFSLDFFLRIFRKFVVNYPPSSVPNVWIIFFILFITGCVYCFIQKKKTVFYLFLVSYFFTMLSLFLFYVSIPFTEKYIIFLYPNMFIIIGAGIYFIAMQLDFLLKKISKKAYSQCSFCILLALAVSSLTIPDIKKIYFEDFYASKKALKYMTDNGSVNDKILAISITATGMRYYAPQFGMDPNQIIDLEPAKTSEFYSKILRSINSKEDLWLVLTIPIGYPLSKDKIREMINPYFEHKTNFPSYLVPGLWDHEIFKIKKRTEFLSSTSRTFLITNDKNPPENYAKNCADKFILKEKSEKTNEYTFTKKFSVLEKGKYFIMFNHLDDLSISSIKASVDNVEYVLTPYESGKNLYISDFIPLETERVDFDIKIILGENSKNKNDYFYSTADISTSCIDVKSIRSYTYADKSYYLDPKYGNADGKVTMSIDRNGFIDFNFDIQREGKYQFLLEGINDDPAPVIVQADVDNKFLGMYGFLKGDNSLEMIRGNIRYLNAGKHNVRLYFINNSFDPVRNIPAERLFAFTQVKTERIEDNVIPQITDIMPRLGLLPVPAELTNLFVTPILDGELSKEGWTLIGGPGVLKIDKVGDNYLKILVPSDVKTNQALVTPLFPLVQKKNAYFNPSIKVQGMKNHSVNIHILALDKNMALKYQKVLYPTGITGDSDWENLPCVETLPEIEGWYAFAIAIYKNGAMPGKSDEFVYVKNPIFSPYK